MKNIFIILLLSASTLVFANPVWVQYDFKVDSSQNAANIVEATDKLMSANFTKNNFKGSLHLNAWIANGNSEATHSYAVLQPSLAEHEKWMNALQASSTGQEFYDVLNSNSTPIFQRVNSFIQTFGNPSNEDIYWIVHKFVAQPSDLEDIVESHKDMDERIKADFPGQFGLSSVMFGSNQDVTHLLTVGYSSMVELEAWEDSVATNGPVQHFLEEMDDMVTWTGSDVLFNARVYDSASDLEQFVTKDFEE